MKKIAILVLAMFTALCGCKAAPKAFIDQEIQAYLDKNPQVIEKKVDEALRKRGGAQPPQAPPQSLEDQIKGAIPVDLNNAPTQGPANAPITIVEFSDFQCPFCSRVVPTVKAIMDEYKGQVRLAFRQHPLPFHPNAMPAAKAALAANQQGKFWQMHDALFEDQQDLSKDNILKIAAKVGLNMKKFQEAWDSNQFDAQIQQDLQFGNTHGATGTPTFFINGVISTGAKPIAAFRTLIDKLLEQKGLKPPVHK